jgi:hypothetical protein
MVFGKMFKNLIVVVLVVLGAGMFLYMLFRTGGAIFKNLSPAAKKTAATPTIAPTRTITVDYVASHPAVFSDLTMTLDGRITDWRTKRAFLLGPIRTSFVGGSSLPVISKNEFKLPEASTKEEISLGESADIKAKGQIKIFDPAAVSAEWGVELGKEVENWKGRPVMLLESYEKI